MFSTGLVKRVTSASLRKIENFNLFWMEHFSMIWSGRHMYECSCRRTTCNRHKRIRIKCLLIVGWTNAIHERQSYRKKKYFVCRSWIYRGKENQNHRLQTKINRFLVFFPLLFIQLSFDFRIGLLLCTNWHLPKFWNYIQLYCKFTSLRYSRKLNEMCPRTVSMFAIFQD